MGQEADEAGWLGKGEDVVEDDLFFTEGTSSVESSRVSSSLMSSSSSSSSSSDVSGTVYALEDL